MKKSYLYCFKKPFVHFMAMFLLIISKITCAQSINLNLKDGTSHSFNLTECKKITFNGNEMNLELYNTDQPAHISIIEDVEFFDSGNLGLYDCDKGIDMAELILYPNPSKEKITLDFFEKQQQPVYVVIYTINGKKIEEIIIPEGESIKTVDTSQLICGHYFIAIETRQQRIFKSFIKL